jgi:hypothetical protein
MSPTRENPPPTERTPSLTAGTTGLSLAEDLLAWLDDSDRQLSRELSEKATLEMRQRLYFLLSQEWESEDAKTRQSKAGLLDELLNFRSMANSALIPGSEGQQRLKDKLLTAIDTLEDRSRSRAASAPDAETKKLMSELRKDLKALAQDARLWEGLDEARRVKTAMRQRSKSVRAILAVLDDKKYASLKETKLKNLDLVRTWAQSMMEAFTESGRVRENLHGSYRTEWELLLTRVFPAIAPVFPEKSTFASKRGRDVEKKFERYLQEHLSEIVQSPSAQGLASFHNSSSAARSDFITQFGKAPARNQRKSLQHLGTEIKFDSKQNLMTLIFAIPGYQSRQLLGVASRVSVQLVKQLNILGASIKIEDSITPEGSEAQFIVSSIPSAREDDLGRIHDLLIEQLNQR